MKGTSGLSRTNSLSQTTSSAGIAGCGFTGLPGKIEDFNNYTLERSLCIKRRGVKVEKDHDIATA